MYSSTPHPIAESQEAVLQALEKDLNIVLPCEGPAHDAGTWGHDPTQAASFVLTLGCRYCSKPSEVQLACRSKVDHWAQLQASGAQIECEDCGHEGEISDFLLSVVPIQTGAQNE